MKIKLCKNSFGLNDQNNSYLEYLDLNEEYTVYGMAIFREEVWYFICDQIRDFPMLKPYSLFEILDSRLSRYWIFGNNDSMQIWIFPEWINDIYFQDKLTDWEEKEMKIFKAYKEVMDLEFPDSSITEVAQIGDDQWLICPRCIDAWENSDCRDAIVRCPKCVTKFNNPRYRNEYPHLPNFC